MKQTKSATLSRSGRTIGWLTVCLGLPLSAYQQGSFFLFDIRDDAATEKGIAGRIVLASSLFKNKASKPESESATKEKKSEFETGVSSFKLKGSDSISTGIKVLDTEDDDATIESSFGEDPPPPSGFYFSY